MSILYRWFLVFAAAMMCGLAADASAESDVRSIVQRLELSQDAAARRSAMAELAAMGSYDSAMAFAAALEDLVSESTPLSDGGSLVPYVDLAFEFSNTADNRTVFVPVFERISSMDMSKWERLYIEAAMAKFGVEKSAQWLLEQHDQPSPEYSGLSASNSILNLLCKVNQENTVRYVVKQAVESVDPTQKLELERCLRAVGNPGSLEIMRRWESIETGDLDLSIAEQYLASIAQFGDTSDIGFVDWLETVAPMSFHPDDVSNELNPLIAAARERIEPSGSDKGAEPGTRQSIAKYVLAFVLVIGLIGSTIYLRRRAG